MENTKIETKIEIVGGWVARAISVVTDLQINTADDYTNAVEIGGKLKKVFKMLTERKEEITKPMNEALKSARALFKPIEENLEKAESELKAKMLDFKEKEREAERQAQIKADEEIAKTQAQLKAKEITSFDADQAIITSIQNSNVEKTDKTVRSETGAKATEKFVLEYVVVDKTKIPLNFLEPDMVKIKASFKAGLPVEGVVEQKKAIISF